LKAFCKMLFTYGRGRAEQFRLHPTPGSALNFVPPLFVVYLALAVALAGWFGLVVFVPLALYFLLVFAQTAVSMTTKGVVRSLLAMPLLVAPHVFYGLGFLRGLTTRLKSPGDKPVTEVTLENMTP
jgi:hypothetical protein